MKTNYILLFVLLCLQTFLVKSQDVSYSSSYSYGGGNPNLVNTTADNYVTGWTQILAPSATANAWSAVQNLPSNFKFHFYGENVTQYKVSYNGVITFSTSATSVPADNATLPSSSLPNNSIACFWDAFATGAGTEADDRVYVYTAGTSPNRQLWIKWYSMKLGSVSNNYFACVLEEGTSNIYMVDLYGTSSQSATVGIQKNTTTGSNYGSTSIKLQSSSTVYTNNNYYNYSPSFSSVSNSYYTGNYYMKKGNPLGINTVADNYTTGWTQILAASKTTNEWSAVQSIPFNFEFFGNAVTSYKVSLNGVLTFNTSATSLPAENSSLPSTSLPDQSIACFWDAFPTSKTNTDDRVYIDTIGTSPNRQLWIRWHSMKYGNPYAENNYFACVLEETSNRIYLVDLYNQSGVTTHTATVGLQLNSTTAINYSNSLRLKSSNSSYWDNNYFQFSPAYDEPILSYTAPTTYVRGNPTSINTETDTYTSGWTAITSGSIATNAWSSTQTLPFNFLFFGETVTQFKATSNGLITFETSTALLPSENDNLPAAQLPDKTITCFWDAFPGVTLSANDIVYTKTFGTAPNRQFWIKWNSMRTGGPYSNDNTFACVLEETTYKIYLVDMHNSTSSLTQAMTLGMQYNGSYAKQYGTKYSRLLSTSSANSDNYYYEFIPEDGDTQVVFTLSELASTATKGLFSPFQEDCAEKSTNSAYLQIQFSTGEIYNYGANAFEESVGFTITPYLTSGAGTESDTIELSLNQNNPLQLFRKEITSDFEDLVYYKIKIKSYSGTGLVSDDIELKANYNTELGVDVSTATLTHEALTSPVSDNPITLTWSSDCDDVPSYQVQILRLYNTSESYKSSSQAVSATVDWGKSLTVYTEHADTTLSIRLTEGSGYYAWRVRPIGTYYEGGIGNDLNYGGWSTSYADGATASISSLSAMPSGDYVFYYEQFDTDKNWIYSRLFTEENKIAESISFANGLQQTVQIQRHQQTDTLSLVGQTLYDFIGRTVGGTILAPVEDNSLQFRDTLILNETEELYTARDFDFDTIGTDYDTYEDPNPMTGGLISRYYSDDNSDTRIPDAQDYPFTREMYYQDGRIKETSAPGEEFRIGGSGEGYTRTIKTYYSGVSSPELIKIFGDEASADSSVYKVIQFDQDKTGKAIYKTPDGKIIATCLIDIWDDHPSRKDLETDSETISDTIKGNISLGTYALKKSKVVVTTDPIVLDVSYSITPQQIEEECGGFCSSCDYQIIVGVLNNEDGTIERIIGDFDGDGVTENKDADTIFIPAYSCRTTLTPETSSFTTDILDPGSYTVYRILMANNTNPDTEEEFINEHLAEVKDNFESDTSTAFQRLYALLADTNISGFYSYLETQTGETIDETTEEVNYSTNCCEVTIPVRLYTCDENPYQSLSEDENGNKDFEQLLFDMWGDEYGTDLYDYFYDTDGTHLYPADATFSADLTFGEGDCSSCDAYLMVGIVRDGDYANVEWLHSGTSISICSSCPTTSLYGSAFANIAESSINSYLSSTYGSSSDYPYTVSVSGNVLTLTANLDNGASHHDQIWVVSNGFPMTGYSATGWGYVYDLQQSNEKSYPLANGAFNSMIHKMVRDGYDGDTLYYCWTGIVSSWEAQTYKNGNPDEGLSGYNLRNSFLDCAGWMVGGISNHPWGATNGDGSYDASSGKYGYGFDEFAYKAFQYDTVSLSVVSTVEADCFAELEWDWTATADDRFESQDDQEWHQFYQCLQGDGFSDMASDGGFTLTSTDITSQEIMIDAMQDSCSHYCDLRANSFFLAFKREAKASGRTVTSADSVCVVDALIAHCKGYCDLDTVHIKADTNGDGVADTDVAVEVDANDFTGLMTALTASFDLQVGSTSCGSDYTFIPTAYSYIREKVVDELNEKLQEFYTSMGTTTATLIGSGLQLMLDDIYSDNAWASSFTCSWNNERGIKFYISSSSYFELRGGSNTILYLVCDNYSSGYRIIDFAGTGIACDGPIYCVPMCFKWTNPDPEPTVTYSFVECEELQANYLRSVIDQQLADCKESHLQELKDTYASTCVAPNNVNDELVVSYTLGYHTYTLFYYDVAGNLVQTVPPLGVQETGTSRNSALAHTYKTQYKYNSLGQRIYKSTPDGGITQYWHDALGRVRFSQNAKQLADGSYTYNKYDDLSRLIEVGQSTKDAADGSFVENIDNSRYPSSGRSEITYSTYTDTTHDAYYVTTDGDTLFQEYTQNRISYINTDPDGRSATATNQVYTYYSYDPHGNVQWMVQSINGFGRKQIAYEYDLLTGKVKVVKYQEGQVDQFYHAYFYDADNRVEEVRTSRDGIIWDSDSRYEYYAYGPLKRIAIGQDYVQGLDHVYTLHGLLKGVNHQSLDPTNDPGGDGISGSQFAEDAWGMELTYYQGDFDRSGSIFNSSNTYHLQPAYSSYVGNITSLAYNSQAVSGTSLQYQGTRGNVYEYDELNRLANSIFLTFNSSAYDSLPDYAVSLEYDANGNITSHSRYGYSGTLMDELAYDYNDDNNQLNHIDDTQGSVYSTDLDDQADNNYQYDEIGRLTSDDAENISSITWTLDNKVKSINKSDGSSVAFVYDGAGNRVAKRATDVSRQETTTYYIRDAKGSEVAIYTEENSDLDFSEAPIYAGGRLGMLKAEVDMDSVITNDSIYTRSLGDKYYELKDHVGNVNVVITDHKQADLSDNTYTAEVVSNTDYYPFGMRMPNMNASSDEYRYGYMGMEFDNETKTNGNSYTTQLRQYDPRVGRWFSPDPKEEKFPSWSAYKSFMDNPIYYTDPTGGEEPIVRSTGNPNMDRVAEMEEMDRRMAAGEIKPEQYQAYYDRLADEQMPDAVGVSITGEVTHVVGGTAGVNFIWYTTGPDASLLPSVYVLAGARTGENVGASVQFVAAEYAGPDEEVTEGSWTHGFLEGGVSVPSASVSAFTGSGCYHDPAGIVDGVTGEGWSGMAVGPGAELGASVGVSEYWLAGDLLREGATYLNENYAVPSSDNACSVLDQSLQNNPELAIERDALLQQAGCTTTSPSTRVSSSSSSSSSSTSSRSSSNSSDEELPTSSTEEDETDYYDDGEACY